MKQLLLLTFLIPISQCSIAQDVDDFQWLEGKWKRQNESVDKSSYEVWERSKDQWNGIGVTLKNSDTVFVEKLSIVFENGTWNYVADVAHNPAPVYFKITSINSNGFTCENPTHDFPKKIQYELSENMITVIISGNGKKIPFTFLKEE